MFYGVKVPLRLWMDEQGGVARPTWRANMTRTPRDALFYKCAKNSLHALLELGTIPEDKYLNSTRGTLSDHGPTMWFRDVGDVCVCFVPVCACASCASCSESVDVSCGE